MPKQKSNLTTLEEMKKYLSVDLLGQIPIFLSHAKVAAHQAEEAGTTYYHRSIEIHKFQTNDYKSRGYHKVISKII